MLIINLFNILSPLMGIPRYIPLTAISFFLTGMYLKRNKKSIDILLDTNNTWYLLLALSSIILFFMVFYYNKAVFAYDVISRLFIFVLSPVVIHLAFLYARKRTGNINIVNDVVSESFFIFATHAIFLGYLSLGINFIFATKCNVLMILLYFFTAAITYVISIIAYKTFKKAFPKITSILTGGR